MASTSKSTVTPSAPAVQPPLKRKRVKRGDLGRFEYWTVKNRALLVQVVARLAVGHFLAVERVLRKRTGQILGKHSLSAINEVSTIFGPPSDEPARYRRDGWAFQLIAWTAQVGELTPKDIIAAPHPWTARHGIDSLVLRRNKNDGVRYVVIGEQKATDKPRSTVRGDVWPDFEEYESGRFDGVLENEVQVLLSRIDEESAMKAAEDVHWGKARRYRASITGPSTLKFGKLFKGYDAKVSGARLRRRGDIMVVDSLRPWFDDFCKEVVVELSAMKATAK